MSAVSAIAARKARLEQEQESSTNVDVPATPKTNKEPLAKKSKPSKSRSPTKKVPQNAEPQLKPQSPPQPDDSTPDEVEMLENTTEPDVGVSIASVAGDEVDGEIDQEEERSETACSFHDKYTMLTLWHQL